jgi:sugar lactone lactonase YvrE
MRLDPIGNLELNNYDNPSGVFLGRNGKDLYFTQPNQHRVVKKDLETGVVQVVGGQGGGGSGLSQMNVPLGVFVHRQGEIFVADHNNHRVMRYEAGSSSGTVIAGGNGAGNGMNQLYGPYGVFVDPQYNVYVVDHHNHRIQRWAPGASSGV